MRDFIIFMAGWIGMWGVQSFHEPVAKIVSFIFAISVYALCLFFRNER